MQYIFLIMFILTMFLGSPHSQSIKKHELRNEILRLQVGWLSVIVVLCEMLLC